MADFRVISVDHPTAPPLDISARLRSQLPYFMTAPDTPHVPPLEATDYWIDAASAMQWAEEGVFDVVSPLDSENATTVELSEEQEILMDWLVLYHIQHLRLHDIT